MTCNATLQNVIVGFSFAVIDNPLNYMLQSLFQCHRELCGTEGAQDDEQS